MNCFAACPRQYYFRYVQGIRPRFAGDALRFGTAMHEVLDLLAKGVAADDIWPQIIEQYRSSEQYQLCDDDGREELEFELVTIQCLASGYQWYWSEQAMDILYSEKVFTLPIHRPGAFNVGFSRTQSRHFELSGKIDKHIRRGDGRTAVMEHKTTSDSLESDSRYWDILRLDPQIGIYFHALLYSPNKPDHVLYDVIRKPAIEPTPVPLVDADGYKIVLDAEGNRVYCKIGKPPKPRETGSTADGYVLQTRKMLPEEWGDKLGADIAARPEYYYARREVARTDQDLRELRREIWRKSQMIHWSEKNEIWPQHVSRNTCGFCEFTGLCESNSYPIAGDFQLPESLVRVDCLHPELAPLALKDIANANASD